MSVSHVSAIPVDVTGREAIAVALAVVGRELTPLATTFFAVGGNGEIDSTVVHGSHLPAAELVEEVRRWKVSLRGADPLAPRTIAALPNRIATLDDVHESPSAVVEQTAYEQIGVINDVRVLIRDGQRVVAGLTLWRALHDPVWTDSQLRLLDTLQPLIEMAYLSALRAAATSDRRLPPTLTQRQRQVARLLTTGATNAEIARALHISPETAKSHTRAVLTKVGVTSRRTLAMRLTHGSPDEADGMGSTRQSPPWPDPTPRRHADDASIRAEGDETPRRMLALVLDWGVERIGAAIGGCALFSARLELVAQARAIARPGAQQLDLPSVRRIQRQLFPPAQPSEIVRHALADRAQSPVLQLDVTGAEPDAERLGELVATLGLTTPLLTVLRLQGRIAGLIWLSRDARAAVDQRESAQALRSLHPLLELAYAIPLALCQAPVSTPGDLAERGLTPRELTVAHLALNGQGNADIAAGLGISQSTVKHHMTRILAKCGVRSRTQLIALFSETSGDD